MSLKIRQVLIQFCWFYIFKLIPFSYVSEAIGSDDAAT